MRQKETVYAEKFLKVWKGLVPGLKYVKMHGSIYQSGVPDYWIMVHGHNVFVEFKKGRPRTVARLLFMCRPMQRRRLLDMAQTRTPGFIACCSGTSWTCVRVADLLGDLDMELCYVSTEALVDFMNGNILPGHIK